MEYREYELGDLLFYEQPTPYIVETTDYDDSYKTPVLTAGKTFVIGFTNETRGIYDKLPVIIFDDFTTSTQYVNFKFKVKSSAMKILTANTELVLPKYMYYRMQLIEIDHSTHKRYWIQQYSKVRISIPPISEQERIIYKIEELFSELDNAEETLLKTREQLGIYRQAVLKSVFSGIEKTESIRRMSSVVTSGSRGWAKYYSDHGAKFIRIGNLTRDRLLIDLADTQYVDLPDSVEGRRTRLHPNDVLVSITADLGSIGLVPTDIGEAYVNQHIAMVRFCNENQSEFFAWYLRSDFGQKDLLKNKRGGGKLGLGLDDIRDSRVPVVSDEEAESIVLEIESRLSVCDSIEQTVSESLQQLQAMRQSILKKAFEGKL